MKILIILIPILITAYLFIREWLLFHIGQTVLMPNGRRWTNKNFALPFLGWVNPEAPKDCGRYYNYRHVRIINFLLKIFATGFHVPTDKEWEDMISACGEDACTKLKSATDWGSNWNGIDKYGFNASPAGYRNIDGSAIYRLSTEVHYWNSSLFSNTNARTRCIYHDDAKIYSTNSYRLYGISIRLIKKK